MTSTATGFTRTRQCKACPWRKSVNPDTDIPGGYSRKKHEALDRTIAEPGMASFGTLRAMACHETTAGAESACVGWVLHQLNAGNNIALRMLAMDGRFKEFRTDGPQHETFEATLGQRRRRR